MSRKPLGLYIHIPFCRSKCRYCAFNSVAVDGFSSEEWVRLLSDEFLYHIGGRFFNGDTHRLSSIYFGGGTPSLLPHTAIKTLVSLFKEKFSISGNSENLEVTLEANPEGLGAVELNGFLEAGVNRLSLGVQSLDDNELKALGRRHNAAEAMEAVKKTAHAGFDNISLDLMYGLPGQTLKSWRETLRAGLDLNAAHISLYNLSIEEHTPFYKLYGMPGKKVFIDEELERNMYEYAIELLCGRGYEHYEISNFARPGLESRHNEGYWLGREYLGLGPGAHSFSNSPVSGQWGRRSWNERDVESYKSYLRKGEPVAGSELLTREEAMVEAVLLGLRMLRKGIDMRAYARAFGGEARRGLLLKCIELEGRGLLHISDDRVVLDKSALFISDEVCLGLVS